MLILADTGGSNGAQVAHGSKRSSGNVRAWDSASPFPLPFRRLQMESHRAPFVQPDQQELGSQPLDSYEKALKFIRTTATTTGLKVTAHLDTTYYPTGIKVSKQELSQLSIRQKRVLPK